MNVGKFVVQKSVAAFAAVITLAILTMPMTATAQVMDFAGLQYAITTAPTNAETDILIGADFAIMTTVEIPANKNITIKGDVPTRKLTRGYSGVGEPGFASIFRIENGGALMLENIVVDGAKETYPTNSSRLVQVSTNAVFTMKNGAVLENNIVNMGSGGAVGVQKDGVFNMDGGTIKDCNAQQGGGVYVFKDGVFNMNGGKISGCTADQGLAVFLSGY